jgi:zinc-ribbon domain
MEGTVCPECGQPADRDAEFCPSCGAYLDWSAIEGRREVRAVGVVPVPDPATAPTVRQRASASSEQADGPVRTATAPTPVIPTARTAGDTAPARPPAPGGCPRCGTDNPPERRFCRKCALEFSPPAASGGWADRASQRRVPWWRRLFGGHRTTDERRALRAYRRSLPTRYRVFRAVAGLLVIALVGAAVWAVNADPIGWARARWDDVQDTLVPVRDVQATLDPAAAQARTDFAPGSAVDGNPATAWATSWTAGGPPASCNGEQRTAERLVLTFPGGIADVRELRIEAGLAEGDERRLQQNRPKVLELRSSDGTCQPVALTDRAAVQTVRLPEPVSTDVLLVDVVDVYPAQPGTTDLVAISEIVLLQRPPR